MRSSASAKVRYASLSALRQRKAKRIGRSLSSSPKHSSVSKSAIELVSGATSPQKRFLIVGASLDAIRTTLNECF